MESARQDQAQPAKRKWRLRWSLRFLIGGVTLTCILFAWLGSIWHMGQVHEEVGTRIESFSTSSAFLSHVQWKLNETMSFQSPGSGNILNAEVKHSPQWMRNTGTELFWQRIKSISLDSELSQKKLAIAVNEISRLDRIESLRLTGNDFPEMYLAHIVTTIELDKLEAAHAGIGDGPIAWLRNSKITDLNLSSTRFSNAAVDDLPITLRRLQLMDTQIDDVGAAKLARLKNLIYLNLRQTSVSREVIKQLDENLPGCLIDWGK
ncbi:hypothetical protein [Blastopirellula marina]|uniref:Leucine-rich repeat domain-containing protein n=1 Tax=Blastopirellula marina TaxID=124 RepID=A0A2S8F4J0_9BACT|nr:hypothetical protein [Blastopirellula marina]PQO27076.1 hypothetical protein C5Y98_27880 [Blastopirellula marina]PTL41223.1 hypothetical protein C5Y97_27895 [Blastopirellula marina]